MKDLIIVGLGGFLGSAARYGIFLLTVNSYGSKAHTATLIVNLAGCLLIGMLGGSIVKLNNQTTLFLITGLCGGFTTFSTFAMDGLKLIRDGFILQFFIYAAISMIGGLAVCFAGFYATNRL